MAVRPLKINAQGNIEELADTDTIVASAMPNIHFPFWDSSGTQACIPTSLGALPFWDSSGTQVNIPIGCS